MKDFTVDSYRKLLQSFIHKNYKFQTFEQYLKNPLEKIILLRQDVDDKKLNSLQFAQIQAELGIYSTFYFRVVPESFDEEVIKKIHSLGHEIGYHYEDMDFANGNPEKAIQFFEKHLQKLRNIVPISTICMHGSPKSKYDNKDLWKHYNYKNYGLIGEPYFELDFNKIAYYTDTGRTWNGKKFSIRDKTNATQQFPIYQTTFQMIEAIENSSFPPQAMLNFHPQRWTNNSLDWYKEYVIQNIKNQVKFALLKLRK